MPCRWVTRRPPVCSGCYLFLANIRDGEKLGRVMVAVGLGGKRAISLLRALERLAADAAAKISKP